MPEDLPIVVIIVPTFRRAIAHSEVAKKEKKMCLAIPAKIVEKDGEKGIVNLGGVNKEIMFTFTPEAKIGDWVIMHTGFALNIISEEDANETLKLFEEMALLEDD